MNIWKPNVTVAALVEQDGRFLLVEEETEFGVRLNQPAGHWDEGETIAAGMVREALEETAYRVKPEALVGIYAWPHPQKDITYLRFAFAASVIGHEPERKLDAGILRALWLTPDEIRAAQDRHRSPLVMLCVEDYLAGRRLPLDSIRIL